MHTVCHWQHNCRDYKDRQKTGVSNRLDRHNFKKSHRNEIDQLYERTGSGIWIHGTEPGFVNRSPRASDGCLSLANDDFLAISRIVKDTPFVPVVIDNAPEWVNVNEHNHRQKILWQTIEEWYKKEVVLGFPALDKFHEEGSPDNPS